ncbi:MAG TPA: PAS domain S-box protein [Deltaproteobacteria bacterium]|nr:PAS domain S-box protein [Candidatus Binatota bacterium]HIL14434.1 PAS domain S-box protein [Deltaproteobacteria bacterium]
MRLEKFRKLVVGRMDGEAVGPVLARSHTTALLSVLIFGLLASCVLYVMVRGWEQRRVQADFSHRASNFAMAVDERLEVGSVILKSFVGLYGAGKGMNDQEFRAMARPFTSGQQGLGALGWAVPGPGKVARGGDLFSARGEQVVSTEPVSQRFALRLSESAQGVPDLLGVDLSSLPGVAAVMEEAGVRGEAMASAIFDLATDSGQEPVFFVFAPVYQAHGEGQGRPAAYAVGLFSVADIVESSLLNMDEIMAVSISELLPSGGRSSLLEQGSPELGRSLQVFAGVGWSRMLEHGGRSWQLAAVPTEGYLATQRTHQAEGLLVTGTQFTVLLVAYLFLAVGRAARIELEVKERTAALATANRDLKREILQRRTAERALRQGEERIRAIVTHAADGIIALDRDGRIESVNVAAEQIFALSATELQGVAISELMELADDGDLGELVQSLQGTHVEVTARRGDGEQLTVGLAVSRLPEEEGGGCFVAVVRDMSRERELDRMKSDFVSTVSHEMRTPLSAIIFAARSLARRKSVDGKNNDASVEKFSGIIVDEGERLNRLINDVLDLSTIETGHELYRIVGVQPADIVERVSSVATTLGRRKGIDFSLKVDADVDPVHADPDRIVQVLMNLLENAIKFTPSGGRVGLTVARHNFNYVRFVVEDNGVGVSVEDKDRIFQRFEQGGDVMTTRPSGTGLGLSICREVVDSHGGSIWVESEPNEGARFSFILPVVDKRRASLRECA